MKILKLNLNSYGNFVLILVAVSYILLGGGNDPVYATQLANKMNTIKSNFIAVGQASSGIGIVIGLILMQIGAAPLGMLIGRGSAIGLVLLFLLPAILNFLQTMGGA